jgi:hypothetical protein
MCLSFGVKLSLWSSQVEVWKYECVFVFDFMQILMHQKHRMFSWLKVFLIYFSNNTIYFNLFRMWIIVIIFIVNLYLPSYQKTNMHNWEILHIWYWLYWGTNLFLTIRENVDVIFLLLSFPSIFVKTPSQTVEIMKKLKNINNSKEESRDSDNLTSIRILLQVPFIYSFYSSRLRCHLNQF